jgi:hypothetical protein
VDSEEVVVVDDEERGALVDGGEAVKVGNEQYRVEAAGDGRVASTPQSWRQVVAEMAATPEGEEVHREVACGVVPHAAVAEDPWVGRGAAVPVVDGERSERVGNSRVVGGARGIPTGKDGCSKWAEGPHLGGGDRGIAEENVDSVDATVVEVLALEVEGV